MRTLALSLLLLLNTALLSARNLGSLTARVVDKDQHNMPIVGATVEISPQEGADLPCLYYATDTDGRVAVPSIAYGDYIVNVSFLGYESSSTEVSIIAQGTELPDIELSSSSVEVEAVVKEIKALRASQEGDSLRYNASAYKVSSDSDVDGLLQKMPGISVEDGKISAQGEEVKKIYIDGKEFFGDDVSVALKSLPAEVVDKIEVYDKQSDESEYSGMDDGNSSKSLNIVTKPNMREGVFGKLFAGGGYEPEPIEGGDHAKYLAGGSVNLFNTKRRITLVGSLNNLNQQGFSFEDIMGIDNEDNRNNVTFMVKSLPGVANVNALGLNYTESFGKKEAVKMQASYFFNKTKTTNYQTLTRWYEPPATDDIDSLHQQTYDLTKTLNNRFNSRIDIKIDDRQSIMIRPSVSFQTTEPFKSVVGERFEEDKYESNDGVQEFANSRNSVWGGYNLSTYGYYRLKFNKRRSLSVGAGVNVNSYDSDSEVVNEPNIPNVNNAETTYKYEQSPNRRRNLSGSVNYMESLNERLALNASYRINSTYQESDKQTYYTDMDFVVDDDARLLTTEYAESRYLTQSVGPGLRYNLKKTRLTASIYYQSSNLQSESVKENTNKDYQMRQEDDHSYENVTYSMVGRISFNKENTMRINLKSSTNAPPVSRFLDNTSNDSYITAGNPELQPTYTHRFNMRYIHSNLESGSTLMAMVGAYMSRNYIASHTILSPEPFYDGEVLYDDVQRYTTWLNLDNYYSFNSHLNYGFPLDFMKCNLNLGGGVSYSLIPSIYGGEVLQMGEIEGGEDTTTKKLSYHAGLTLGSNISENVDFTLSWYGNYNDSSNNSPEAQSISSNNKYFNHSANAYMKFIVWDGFTITGNVNFRQYLGMTNDYNDRYTLCNLFIGHKVLHKDRGEINIGINDILNQHTNFVRSVSSTYTQNVNNSTLGRYVSVQFIYNLRHFKKKESN